MGYLKIITEQEAFVESFEYPKICYIQECDMIRWPIPNGYTTFDGDDGLWQSSNGDFLPLE